MRENIYTKNVDKSLEAHLEDSYKTIDQDHFFVLCLQGSQNYELAVANSDVDTKMLLLPTFEEVVKNQKALSTTYIRENNEHIDFKDCRLAFQLFLKQNISILEILFTKYFIVNPLYLDEWNILKENREKIAHYNIARAVSGMRGMAMEKYHALQHPYPNKEEVLKKFGYDPKQLHHLLRLEEFMRNYINGKSFEECLVPKDVEYLKRVKLGLYDEASAVELAEQTLKVIDEMAAPYKKKTKWDVNDDEVEVLLSEVLYSLMAKSVKKDLER